MRHNVSKIKLGRPKKEREALMRGLAQDLILHGRLRTTEAKAKAVKPIVERLLNLASRTDHRTAVREAGRVLSQESASRHLLGTLAPNLGSRTTGLVRIRKVGVRKGDSAPLVQIELL